MNATIPPIPSLPSFSAQASSQTTEEMQVSETRYRRLFEAARDGILILDAVTCKITDVNPFLMELLGYSRAELLGKELFEIGLLKDAAASQDMYQELQKTGYIRYDNLPLVTNAGQRREVEFVSNVYEENGKQVIQCNIRDITQRKQVENQLLTSESSLARAQQVAHLGSWEWELTPSNEWSDSAARWSDETFRILGYEPGEVEASYDNFIRVLHPDDRARLEASSPRALQERKLYSVDPRLILPDGNERVVHWRSEFTLDSEGNPLKMFGTVQDITERKRGEEAMARLAAIVDSSDDAIISKTLDGIITTWNAGAQKLYGYTAPEAIGRAVSFLAPLDMADEMPQLLDRIRRGESVEHYETVRVRKDGSLLDVSISISPLRDEQGKIIGASSIKHDITQRKRDEQQLRIHSQLLGAIGHSVIVTDSAGTITYWNNSAERIYGWPSSEALGKNILETTPTDKTKGQAVEILDSLAQGKSWSGEFITQRRDGTTFPAHVTDTPVLDEDGKVVSIIGLSLDISERKQIEAALRESEERYQSIVSNVPGMVYQFTLHPDGSMSWPFVGPGCRELFEAEPETLQNDPVWLRTQIHPDDLGTYDSSTAASAATLLPLEWVGRLCLPSGATKWVQITSRPQRLPDGGTLWNG